MSTTFCITKSPRKSILIVEAEELLGHLLKEYIGQRTNWYVHVIASDVDGAVESCQAQQPDVVIVSRYIKGGPFGSALITKLRQMEYDGKIIFLSRNETPEVIQDAISSGASAFVSKYCAPDVVLEVITKLVEEEADSQFVVKPDYLLFREPQDDESRYSSLTETEKEVLLLIAQGLTVKEIAFDLHKAHTTIYSHQQNIKDKFNIYRSNELFTLARDFYHTQQETA
jgi:DNA-binding NarL/FixJ family response regulator